MALFEERNRKKQEKEKHGERKEERWKHVDLEQHSAIEQHKELAAEVRRAVCTSLAHCLC